MTAMTPTDALTMIDGILQIFTGFFTFMEAIEPIQGLTLGTFLVGGAFLTVTINFINKMRAPVAQNG